MGSTRRAPARVLGLSALALALAITATSDATAASSRVSSTARAQYRAARRQWVAGALAASVEQATYFRRAAADLTRAVVDGASPAGAYRSAAAQLRQLAALPETSDTTTQIAQAKHDLRALNRFFDTANLYE